jgi:hypothetical protein
MSLSLLHAKFIAEKAGLSHLPFFHGAFLNPEKGDFFIP